MQETGTVDVKLKGITIKELDLLFSVWVQFSVG